MRPQTAKRVGSTKTFGPIRKLEVPDFQHISHVYEQLQTEALDQPSKKRTVKNFTIRKATIAGRSTATGTRNNKLGDGSFAARGNSAYGSRGSSAVGNRANSAYATAPKQIPQSAYSTNDRVQSAYGLRPQEATRDGAYSQMTSGYNTALQNTSGTSGARSMTQLGSGLTRGGMTGAGQQMRTSETASNLYGARPPTASTVKNNPWIHAQTHQEYLEKVTGLPARHADLVKKHKHVVKETTFLPKDDEEEKIREKDKATKEAVAILEKEYEIFRDPNMPGIKVLARYDTWEADKTVEEWLDYCSKRPDQPHGLSPMYIEKEYVWRPVKVVGYNYADKKFKVVSTGSKPVQKEVSRLSLLFYAEDPELFKERVNLCKRHQNNVEAELRFTNYVDSVPTDAVSGLTRQCRESFLAKCMRQNDKYEPDTVYHTYTLLMRVVQEEFIRQMKKCLVLNEMQDPENFSKFNKLRIPIRLSKKTAPYFGVVRCQKYNFIYYQNEILRQHWCSDPAQAKMTDAFAHRCIQMQKQRYMLTDKKALKLPRTLEDLKKVQDTHHKTTAQNVLVQWREYLQGEIGEILQNSFNFFEPNAETYQESQTKRVILRFEYMLNTYLRQFVEASINDWVSFIQTYTKPIIEKGELWKLNTEPFIIINLDKFKDKKAKKGKEAYSIEYSPKLNECTHFITDALNQIIASNNQVETFENDLMTFLELDKKPSFQMTKEFPWVTSALEKIQGMIEENVVEPQNLLEQYQKFDFILNTEGKSLVKELFLKDKKAPLSEIKATIKRFDQAADDILVLSNDEVDFQMFRVKALSLKKYLREKANKIKQALLDQTSSWCKEKVIHIFTTYSEMETEIQKVPQDEKQLVDLKAFIKKSKDELVPDLKILLTEVENHYSMLDEFFYFYEHQDIEDCIQQKTWPINIEMAIGMSAQTIETQETIFKERLEQEQIQFVKDLKEYDNQYKFIITYNNFEKIQEYVQKAYILNKAIEDAEETVEKFNYRETLFDQKELTEFPDLARIKADFQPFKELIDVSNMVKNNIGYEYVKNTLMSYTYEDIEENVNKWHMKSFQLAKALDDEHEEAAEVARTVKNAIDDFKNNMPLIKCITLPALQEEDWRQIKEAVGDDTLDRDQITVEKFKDFNLQAHIGVIEEIASSAQRKDNLNKKLKGMKEELKEFKLQSSVYPRVNPFTHVLKEYDDVITKLEDQLVQTQGILSQLGAKAQKSALKRDAESWEKKLRQLSDLIDEVQRCQRIWMYLEPIFASDDIAKTLPEEHANFQIVDELWKATMTVVQEDAVLSNLPDNKDQILPNFLHANALLTEIQRHLDDYLDDKCQSFPRFYFLAADDLLKILAQTKDPTLVQPHMGKCFEGIKSVVFNGSLVTGMNSAEKEHVKFTSPIDVEAGDKKGKVEVWMLEIEEMMKTTLKNLTKNALEDFKTKPREQWVRDWPGQVILACDQIHWTGGTQQGIKDFDQGGLEDQLEHCGKNIMEIVHMVKGELPEIVRITLKALIVLEVFCRDQVKYLIDQRCDDVNSFDWLAQLRYYWEEKDTCRVRMVTGVLDYGYEYLGNSLRLVITPLTVLCYRTLMGAKTLNYGGAPEGPAGTGKTETVKDLAKALAFQCVVFNCSDDLDHTAMAKFFKGQASSGAWFCFDEFNRINPEVLSVIASQILVIQSAIARRERRFDFFGTELVLKAQCNTNITMNPGYAGRSELPDNLKALFRPCAMMVPDYSMIAEIELYSFGFSEARPLAIKITKSLSLSNEQLSSQFHYDFGMRALKSILTACGNLRMELGDTQEEQQICLRALNDSNVPKFTADDIPLYSGITSDLFPGVKLPEPDYVLLLNAMNKVMKKMNLQAKEEFVGKSLQLYDMIRIRHGLMMVGQAFSGKTKAVQVLKEAMTLIYNEAIAEGKDPKSFLKVQQKTVNPKSIKKNQLYGNLDENTNEWTDGVLAIIVRDFAESESPDRKWVMFDGPVDAVWIENMNTVLDDNKKLCLNSGAVIKLSNVMTMMFEVDDLSFASPATVSRCGMIFLEPHQLGHTVLITSYLNTFESNYNVKLLKNIREAFHYIADLSVLFSKNNLKFPQPTGPNSLIDNMIKLFDTYNRDWLEEGASPPNDAEEKLLNALVFSCLWAIGGQSDEHTRAFFDVFIQELIAGENVIEKYNLDLKGDGYPEYELRKINTKFGGDGSLFDFYFDRDAVQWISWDKTVPQFQIPVEEPFTSMIVPTMDSIRIKGIFNRLILNKSPVLIVGPTGTGKSVMIAQELAKQYQNEDYTYIAMAFSAQTTALQTQNIIDGKLYKLRRGVYVPQENKQGVIFVDDLNMPKIETPGINATQPAIELLRQWMDYKGWFDILGEDKDFKNILNFTFITAMSPPGAGKNNVTQRYIRHFNVIYVEPYSSASIIQIFSSVMDWFYMQYQQNPFSQGIKSMKEKICLATIQTYEELSKQFRPTPAKSHYTYNLRDVSKVFGGISKTEPRAMLGDDSMVKLWAHECMRVFHDRLVSQSDRDQFVEMLKEQMQDKFKKTWEKIVEVEPLLFASFVPTIHPEGDTSKRAFNDIYCELTDRDKLKKVCEDGLVDFNTMNRNKQMDLVLFSDAMEHCIKIHRVITTEFGHALLVGVGGSGRNSLTELATFLANFTIVKLDIPKGYTFDMWRDDLKNQLYLALAYDMQNMIFFFSDTQLIDEAFLEDINNILNNGEVPNLLAEGDDFQNVIERMKEQYKADAVFKENEGNQQWIYNKFLQGAKNKLHMVLAFSHIGQEFKTRLRMFPALVNCCTIDWFLAWPPEALKSVATYFLSEVPDLPQLEGIVDICVDMQKRVQELSERFKNELGRYYYVTPTSYLILINTFKTKLKTKRDIIQGLVHKYGRGLKALARATITVNELKANLEVLIPQVKEKSEQAGKKAIEIEKKRKEVEIEQADCALQEDQARKEKSNADEIQADCDQKLAEVMPIFEKAVKAVNKLKPGDVTELKSFKKVASGVQRVANVLCLMFETVPKIPKNAKEDEILQLYWDHSVKNLLKPDLITRLRGYPKEDQKPEVVAQVKEVIASPEFDGDLIKKASVAASGMADWARAIIQFHDALLVVKPRQAQLKEAKEAAEAAMASLKAAQDKLDEVQKNLLAMVNELKAVREQEASLKNQKENCEFSLSVAKSLIEGLAEEKTSWEENEKKEQQNEENLVGDIIICSGFIAYLGIFLNDYREQCKKQWVGMLETYHIKSNEDVSLEAILGDSNQRLDWVIHGLPDDGFSVENAIIQDNSERWTLMVDPQMQGNNWLRDTYGSVEESQLQIIKPTTDTKIMTRKLDQALSYGYPVIFEDANETFDPMLEPIISRQIQKRGADYFITFNQNPIMYNTDFKFFITTKMAKPHYSPEMCVKVTMLNFMVTQEGLQEFMLNIVVSLVETQRSEQRVRAIRDKAARMKTMKELQDTLLDLVSNAGDDILENRALKETLDESAITKEDIKTTLADIKSILDNMKAILQQYTPVAKRVSNLFFVLTDLVNVDPMYQYSLEFFRNIYKVTIKSAEKIEPKMNGKERLKYFIREFTANLYRNVSRSLFVKDKLLFSFLICLQIMREVQESKGGLDEKSLRFLMTGGTKVTLDNPNPVAEGGWLSDKMWASIEQMSEQLSVFNGFAESFTEDIELWHEFYQKERPASESVVWPGRWNDLTILHKTVIMRILRPDRVITMVQRLIVNEEELGRDYIIPPSFDMMEIYNDSNNKSPLIIVLSPGADPMIDIQELRVKLKQQCVALSLGRGQEPAAINAIKKAQEEGTWVVLANCHLAPSFMPILDGILDQIVQDENSNFRLWLTTLPSDKFPVTVVQNGVKATLEPPQGMRNNLVRSYRNVITQKEFDDCDKPDAFKRLFYGLCFFNALILERRKFGPLGWNIPYSFAMSDLRISKQQLSLYLNEFVDIPYDALNYMVAKANYGGRVTDPQDKRTISILLAEFFNKSVVENDEHSITPSGSYKIPPTLERSGYIEYTENLPLEDSTEVFGMHPNAEITSNINSTNALMATALSLLPKVSSSGGKTRDQEITDLARDILERLPKDFELEEAKKRYPISYNESMNTVLQQELLRYNRLTSVMRVLCINIGKAIKGEVVMSTELEQVANNIYDNIVPQDWKKWSYNSMKPLASYVQDLLLRLANYRKWIEDGAPSVFWISGFHFTHSFLTGLKQNFARKYTIPIDNISFNFKVISDPNSVDTSVKPDDGAFVNGLNIEGCRWDSVAECLEESHPKVLLSPMPILWIIPCKTQDVFNEQMFECPLYITLERRGVLSTIGLSNNYVMMVWVPMQKQHSTEHWVKRGVAMITQNND